MDSDFAMMNGGGIPLPAGFSEHQLGLALDVGSSAGSMAEAEEGVWIAENAGGDGMSAEKNNKQGQQLPLTNPATLDSHIDEDDIEETSPWKDTCKHLQKNRFAM